MSSEFTEQAMVCMEQVRQSGHCNMFDGSCVATIAESICDEGAGEISGAFWERRGYGKVLAAFAVWTTKVAEVQS